MEANESCEPLIDRVGRCLADLDEAWAEMEATYNLLPPDSRVTFAAAHDEHHQRHLRMKERLIAASQLRGDGNLPLPHRLDEA